MAAARRAHWVKLGLMGILVCCAGSAAADPTESTPSEEPKPYVAPPPIRIYRFHVYSTMKSRWKKTIMIDSLVSTSQGGVVSGDRGLLERRLDTGSETSDWAPIAKVVVKKLMPKGRLEVEIESEETEAKVRRNGKLPFAPGVKVRLQIDRQLTSSG